MVTKTEYSFDRASRCVVRTMEIDGQAVACGAILPDSTFNNLETLQSYLPTSSTRAMKAWQELLMVYYSNWEE